MRGLADVLSVLVLLFVPCLLGRRAHNLLNEVYGPHRDLHPVLGSAALFWLIPVMSLLASGALWGRVSRRWGIAGKPRARLVGIALSVTGVWWVADLLWLVVMGLAATAPDSGGPPAGGQLRFALFFG